MRIGGSNKKETENMQLCRPPPKTLRDSFPQLPLFQDVKVKMLLVAYILYYSIENGNFRSILKTIINLYRHANIQNLYTFVISFFLSSTSLTAIQLHYMDFHCYQFHEVCLSIYKEKGHNKNTHIVVQAYLKTNPITIGLFCNFKNYKFIPVNLKALLTDTNVVEQPK